MRLDHTVISVPSLETGIDHFTSLGFDVLQGGSHGLTENALIVFSDGTYIELLTLTHGWSTPLIKLGATMGVTKAMARRRADVYRRLLPWLGSAPGPLDWCVRVDDIEASLDRWSTEPSEGDVSRLHVREFERHLTDGRTARWYLGSPTNFELPFLLQDLSDLSIRVPPRSTKHPNGATGIESLWLAPSNTEQTRRYFASAFDRSDEKQDSFQAGTTCLKLVATPNFVGKFALTIRAEVAQPQTLDSRLTFGTTMHLVKAD